MRSGRFDAAQKVLGMLFPENFRDRLESLKQDIIAQSGISEIKIEDSKYLPHTFEFLITGDTNNIISASSVIFSSFIPDPLSKTRMDVLIPEQSVGTVIGTKGSNISMICQNTKTKIGINKYSPTSQVGTIDGTFEAILKAMEHIIEFIYEKPRRASSAARPIGHTRPGSSASRQPSVTRPYYNYNNFEHKVERETVEEITKMITVPQSKVWLILEQDMGGLKRLKDMSECNITLHDSEGGDMKIFQVKGMPLKVEMAIELIKAKTNQLKPNEIDENSKTRGRESWRNRENPSREPEEYEEEKKIPLIEDFTRLNIARNQKAVSLVIGQTGSGKSTFINYLTNFFRKGSLNNRKIAIPTKALPQTERDFNHTERLISSEHSQTNNCCPYEFTDLESSSTFIFIDTPGIGDTRGVEQDDENIQKIIQEVLNYREINAIIIVQNGSEARNTASIKYCLTKLRNSLPALVETNIILILTNCPITSNFNADSLQIVPRTTILMDNNALNIINLQSLNKFQLNHLQLNWNNSMLKIKELVEFICTMDTVGTGVFQKMIDEVSIAKQNFLDAQSQLTNLYNLREKLEEVRGLKQSALSGARAYENYIKTETVWQTEWIESPDVHKVCPTHSSLGRSNGIKKIRRKKPTVRRTIYKTKRVLCKRCGLKKTAHYHTRRVPVRVQRSLQTILNEVRARTPVQVQKSVQRVDYDAKEKYDKHTAQANILRIQESNCEKDIKLVEKSIEDTKMKIRTAVRNLRAIAPNYNIAEEIDGILQEARMQLKIDSAPKERAKTRIVIRVLEEIYNNLLG